MQSRIEIHLPDKLSDLLDMALDDLREIEKDGRYIVNMHYWHVAVHPREDTTKCYVCLAGAVLARKMNHPMVSLHPDGELPENEHKLQAIDHLREGNVDLAFKELGLPDPGLHLNRDVDWYEDDRVAFTSNLRNLATDLRKLGY